MCDLLTYLNFVTCESYYSPSPPLPLPLLIAPRNFGFKINLINNLFVKLDFYKFFLALFQCPSFFLSVLPDRDVLCVNLRIYS